MKLKDFVFNKYYLDYPFEFVGILHTITVFGLLKQGDYPPSWPMYINYYGTPLVFYKIRYTDKTRRGSINQGYAPLDFFLECYGEYELVEEDDD